MQDDIFLIDRLISSLLVSWEFWFWQIYGEALYERYSSDIEDSPIARSNYEAEVGVGFIYLF